MEQHKRPVGISILAILHIVGGGLSCIYVLFLIVLFSSNLETQQVFNNLGDSLSLLPPAILAVISGIGMWKGRRWGWYLGLFYYVYSIVRNLIPFFTLRLLMNSIPYEEVANLIPGPAYYYMKYGMGIIVHLLIYLYFFKDDVRTFFQLRLSKKGKWKPILVALCISILIAILFSISA